MFINVIFALAINISVVTHIDSKIRALDIESNKDREEIDTIEEYCTVFRDSTVVKSKVVMV
jgi:hypothetical protein